MKKWEFYLLRFEWKHCKYSLSIWAILIELRSLSKVARKWSQVFNYIEMILHIKPTLSFVHVPSESQQSLIYHPLLISLCLLRAATFAALSSFSPAASASLSLSEARSLGEQPNTPLYWNMIFQGAHRWLNCTLYCDNGRVESLYRWTRQSH